MERTGNPQRSTDPEAPRQAEQALPMVEFIILARIDDVESGGPEGDGCGEPQNSRIQGPGGRDPGRRWSDPQREAEDQMGKSGEPLCEGIKEKHGQRQG